MIQKLMRHGSNGIAVFIIFIIRSAHSTRVSKTDASILFGAHETTLLQNRFESRCQSGLDEQDHLYAY